MQKLNAMSNHFALQLSPCNTIDFAQLVDVAKLQALMDSFNQVIGIANAVIDVQGKVIAHAGWQEACTDFHRVHPESCSRCVKSDTSLVESMTCGLPYAVYECLNGLVDTAAPILVDGQHVANVFTGQFLTNPPDLDFFRKQARRFGYDEARYLQAILRVPVISPERVAALTRLYAHLASTLADSGMEHLRQLQATESLRELNQQLEDRVAQRTHELSIAKDAAESSSAAKTKFLAAASHDLRQPLQAINMFYDALRQSGLNAEQHRITEYLGLSIRALDDLLNTLLDMSRLDAGVIKPAMRHVMAEDIFVQAETEFAAPFLKRGLRFKLAFPQRPVAIYTDRQILARILRNLIDNAAKYCERGGVLVGLRRRGDRAVFQVWDTGIGISREHLDKIFDEYYQIDNPERDRSKGLGLGLSIVRRLASLIGGEIKVSSRPGKGSLFSLLVPLVCVADVPVLPPDNSLSVNVLPEGTRVAVIEDDVWVRTALKSGLGAVGLQVTAYATGEEALDDPDLLAAEYYVSDFRLPGINGLQLLNRIKERCGGEIAAVLLTGETLPAHIEKAAAAGWRTIFKPVELNALVSSLAASRH